MERGSVIRELLVLARQLCADTYLIVAGNGKLRVFDCDDTLISSRGFVNVTHADGNTDKLDSATFAHYTTSHGDHIDFGAFNDIIEPRIIKKNWDTFRKHTEEQGTRVVILTARPKGSASAIKNFLDAQKIKGVEIVALASSDPYDKARWIDKAIAEGQAKDVQFYDDSAANTSAVEEYGKKHEGIQFQTINVPHPQESDYEGEVIHQTFHSTDPSKSVVHINKPEKVEKEKSVKKEEEGGSNSPSRWWRDQTHMFQQKYCKDHPGSQLCKAAAVDSNAAIKKAIKLRAQQCKNKNVQKFIPGFLEKIDSAGESAGIWLETLEADYDHFSSMPEGTTKGFTGKDFEVLEWVLFGDTKKGAKHVKKGTIMDKKRIARELVGIAKDLTIKASQSRHCQFYLAKDGQWYMELSPQEHDDADKADTYGPFASFEDADEYLMDNFSNPGMFYTDKSGKKPVPVRSPNGRPVQAPKRNRGW